MQPKQPKCPFCQAQPCPVSMGTTSWDFGQATAYAAIYCCAVCGVILSIAPLQIPPAKAEQAPAPQIIIPQ